MGLFSAPRLASGDLIEVGGVSVRLRVDARARRVSLRIDARRREVVATAPSQRRLADAVAFAGQRAGWIARQMGALPPTAALEPGGRIEVLGRSHHLVQARTRLEAGFGEDPAQGPTLAVFGAGDAYGRAALRLLKRHALQVLSERTAHYARALGRPLPPVTIGDAKARWGSCRTPRPGVAGDVGAIRYSWRLVLAPMDVVDYVAAHECAHLLEGNHGPRFWSVVERIYGPWRPQRDWLKRHGQGLHAFGR
ncbi:MAG TPA: SprT family zinc-dependent metalloprotease [Caulobacteraceae bacterium]|nr:SprT family zinc-dependent metalloprotease [Caulobacteraceae bacterium]